ncbi:MAG: FAD-binding protein [Patescibacteria group bacterium]
MGTFLATLQQAFPNIQFHAEYSLAPLTTVKIGGPAEFFCEIKNRKTFVELVTFCQKENFPFTVIGWGANTLIADRGIRGLVVKYSTQEISVEGDLVSSDINTTVEARWQHGDTHTDEYPEFDELDYSEVDQPRVQVEIEAGVPLPFAITALLQQNITGLQWFSRIPATIGGAIFNNIHGGTHFMSEYIVSAKVIDKTGQTRVLEASELEFGYDSSRFHHSEEIIISATFSLFKGDVEKAKQVVSKWAVQKKNQPQNSLGCVFQNISKEDQSHLKYPTPSVGYIVDNVLNKKGFRIGDAQISEKHAAFIENKGKATAQDYLEIIKIVITEIKDKTGLKITPEIFFKGFTQQELAFLQ